MSSSSEPADGGADAVAAARQGVYDTAEQYIYGPMVGNERDFQEALDAYAAAARAQGAAEALARCRYCGEPRERVWHHPFSPPPASKVVPMNKWGEATCITCAGSEPMAQHHEYCSLAAVLEEGGRDG